MNVIIPLPQLYVYDLHDNKAALTLTEYLF